MSKATPEHVDRYYKAVGRAIRAWAQFECTLVLLLHVLLETDQFRARIVWAQMPNFRARRTLLATLAATYLDPDPLKHFNGLLNRAKTLGDKRNMLAHSVGILEADTGHPFFMRDKQDRDLGFNFFVTERYSLNNVEGWANAIETLERDFIANGLFGQLHTSPKIHREPHLRPKE